MVGTVSKKVTTLLNAAAARSVVEDIISTQESSVNEALGWAESSYKSGVKEQSKHSLTKSASQNNKAIEPSSGRKLFLGIGSNITQDWLKSKGGIAKFLAWMWQGAELGSALGGALGGAVAWPVALVECGFFALDVWEEQIKVSHAEAVNDLTKKFDRVLHVHTEIARSFRNSAPKLLKTCEAMPARIVDYWSKGTGQKALKAVGSASGNPAGRTILIGLMRKALLNHLMELDAARYELYLMGTNCDALVKHGENVASDSSNAACGFPEYKGYRLPQRGQIIRSETAPLANVVKQCDGCETRLSNVAFNMWSLVGYQLGIPESAASGMMGF